MWFFRPLLKLLGRLEQHFMEFLIWCPCKEYIETKLGGSSDKTYTPTTSPMEQDEEMNQNTGNKLTLVWIQVKKVMKKTALLKKLTRQNFKWLMLILT